MSYDFDCMVIGGGAAGLTAAGMAASIGAETALVEEEKLGGDCTWTGCVPSKKLLAEAKRVHQLRSNESASIPLDDIAFSQILERVRTTREEIYEEADSPEQIEKTGAEVLSGRASFVDSHTLKIDTEEDTYTYTARYIIIAAGASPQVPPIDGIESVPYYTNETIFEIEEQPEQLGVVGGGPIGVEMAQAFQRLGTHVTLFQSDKHILSNDHPQLAQTLQETLSDEGVQIHCGSRVDSFKADEDQISVKTAEQEVSVDAVLLAVGREPNIQDLGLEHTSVQLHPDGISVDTKMQTNASHIYAAGDITGEYQFTHMAEEMAKVAVTNALLKFPKTLSHNTVPWVTYTDPQLAHIGKTQQVLDESGADYSTYRFPLKKSDRHITEGETAGEVRVYATDSGTVLGADALGADAGEYIATLAVAMQNNLSMRNIADSIMPYPTKTLALRRAADQWYIQNQPTWLLKTLKWLFGYTGTIREYGDNEII